MQTEQLAVTGMTCGGCVTRVTRALRAAPGVGDVTVSLSTGEARVHYDERLISPAQLKSVVTDAGYGVNETKEAPAHHSKHSCCA